MAQKITKHTLGDAAGQEDLETSFKITKHTLLGDITRQYPETKAIFFRYGLHCVGCHVSMFETIEQGAIAHGFTPHDLDNLIKDLNDAISKTEQKR